MRTSEQIAARKSGSYGRPVIAPAGDIPSKRVSKLAKEYVELVQRERAAKAELEALEAQRPTARQADLERDAALVREGKLATGPFDEKALQGSITAAGHDLDVLRTAVDRVLDELAASVGEDRGSILESIAKRRERARSESVKRLEELGVLRAELERLNALERWARTFPDGKRYGVWHPLVELPNGSLDFGTIVSALTRDLGQD